MNKDEGGKDGVRVKQYLPKKQMLESEVQIMPLSNASVIEVEDDFRAPDELLEAQRLANLLDTAVKIPFIGIRVGLDFLVGLIPGIGDGIMLFASLRILFLARKMNLPKALQVKILKTLLLDYGLGFVPILGDIVDLFYKGNQINVRTMETWWVSENKEKIDALAKRQVDEWHAAQDSKESRKE